MKPRTAKINRETKETSIKATVNLDGTGKTSIQTGISFLDHMITSFAKHSMIDLTIKAKSLDNIEHHLIEDVGITIGAAIDKSLGNRSGITRFSFASVPMDESLAETSIDLIKRPFTKITLLIKRTKIEVFHQHQVTPFFLPTQLHQFQFLFYHHI